MYADLERKVCPFCKERKEKKEFSADRTAKDGLNTHCRKCKSDQFSKWKSQNIQKLKDKEQKRQLKRYYGMTLEEYKAMFVSQKMRCKICEIHQSELTRSLSVDHCHKTKAIRGLLCDNCNPMLGYAKDDITRLEKAIEYLRSSRS